MGKSLVLPTGEQAQWMDCELGVLIHYDMVTHMPSYVWDKALGSAPDVSAFHPDALDTDNWLEAAASMGAKYAILVAKHCSGFCLWPTKAHAYSVATSQWKDGKGDIVADFIASCQRFGILPGLYYSANANGYLGMNAEKLRSAAREEQEAYYRIVMQQLTELWSNYGPLFEIWFDGGVIPPADGGPDIAGLLHTLQPNAVVFQGPPGTKSLIRWVGNESGMAPENCSAIVQYKQEAFDGTESHHNAGDTFGNLWCPAEADAPNRHEFFAFQGGWFWHEKQDRCIIPPKTLLERYISSVGRNTNFLLGMGIDKHGRFPDKDAKAFADFGKLLENSFHTPLCECETKPGQSEYLLPLPPGRIARYFVAQEDITQGERVLRFSLHHRRRGSGELRTLYHGNIISHKRIILLKRVKGGELLLRIEEAKAEPQMRKVAVY